MVKVVNAKCLRCGKVIHSMHKGSLEYNMSIHDKFCKLKQEELKRKVKE